MTDERQGKKEQGGGREQQEGPSVFPRPGKREGTPERDPEEEGSAGKTQR